MWTTFLRIKKKTDFFLAFVSGFCPDQGCNVQTRVAGKAGVCLLWWQRNFSASLFYLPCDQRSMAIHRGGAGHWQVPKNYWQYFVWCHKFLPGKKSYYTAGLAATCWAIWLARNRATFEKNKSRLLLRLWFIYAALCYTGQVSKKGMPPGSCARERRWSGLAQCSWWRCTPAPNKRYRAPDAFKVLQLKKMDGSSRLPVGVSTWRCSWPGWQKLYDQFSLIFGACNRIDFIFVLLRFSPYSIRFDGERVRWVSW